MDVTNQLQEYNSAKAAVKAWEREYRSEHNKRPDRRALSAAAPHVQAAYSTYYRLRTALDEATTSSSSSSSSSSKTQASQSLVSNCSTAGDCTAGATTITTAGSSTAVPNSRSTAVEVDFSGGGVVAVTGDSATNNSRSAIAVAGITNENDDSASVTDGGIRGLNDCVTGGGQTSAVDVVVQPSCSEAPLGGSNTALNDATTPKKISSPSNAHHTSTPGSAAVSTSAVVNAGGGCANKGTVNVSLTKEATSTTLKIVEPSDDGCSTTSERSSNSLSLRCSDDAGADEVWGRSLNRSVVDVPTMKKNERAPLSDLYSKLAENMRASFLASPSPSFSSISLKRRKSSTVLNKVANVSVKTMQSKPSTVFNASSNNGLLDVSLKENKFSTDKFVDISMDGTNVDRDCLTETDDSATAESHKTSSVFNDESSPDKEGPFEEVEPPKMNFGNKFNGFSSSSNFYDDDGPVGLFKSNPFKVQTASKKTSLIALKPTTTAAVKSNRLAGKINSSWMKRCFDNVNEGDEVVYDFDEQNHLPQNLKQNDFNTPTIKDNLLKSKIPPKPIHEMTEVNEDVYDSSVTTKDPFDICMEDIIEHETLCSELQSEFWDSPASTAAVVTAPACATNNSNDTKSKLAPIANTDAVVNCAPNDTVGSNSQFAEAPDADTVPDSPPIVRRLKRKKLETLEELEESDKITPVWPPPKKKRLSRIVKNSVDEVDRHKLSIKAKRMKIETDVPSKSTRVRVTRRAAATRRRGLLQPVPEDSETFARGVDTLVTLATSTQSPAAAGGGPTTGAHIDVSVRAPPTTITEETPVISGSSITPSSVCDDAEESGTVPAKRKLVRARRLPPKARNAQATVVEHDAEPAIRVAAPKIRARKSRVLKNSIAEEDAAAPTESVSETADDAVTEQTPQDGTIPEYDEQLEMEKNKARRFMGGRKYVDKKDRLEDKVNKGTLNQNYIKIDLKKKTFVRGKKSMTGCKFRRLEWKRKQGMKSASFGKGGGGGSGAAGGANYGKKLTCFKCGDFGHWASKCPGKKSKDSILNDEDRPPVSYLTLEEAADMAKGIRQNDNSNVTRVYSLNTMSSERKENIPSVEDQVASEIKSDVVTENMDCAPVSASAASALAEEDDKDSESENNEVDSPDEITSDVEDDTELPHSSSQKSTQGAIAAFEEESFDDYEFAEEVESAPVNKSKYTVSSSQNFHISSSQNFGTLRQSIEPLLSGDITECPKLVMDTLRLFGHSSFRPGQEAAILRILQGKSTLLVLSTGSGKSLCYQLPAYLYAMGNKCITLCVSPLVSLMEDQVTGLPAFLHAVCLHTNQTPQHRQKALQAVRDGQAHILLVSPEAVVASGAGGLLGTLMKDLPPVAFACVDEAHCVSQWSHNFRPSYLRVCRVLREQLGVRTILGLTATARYETTLNIAEHLLVDDFTEGIITGSSVPPNLLLSVSRDSNRAQALIELLQGERFEPCDSIIVYCTRRDECERVATLLRTQLLTASKIDVKANLKRNRALSFDAEAYHAGLSAYRRRTIQNRFMSGKLRIVVATVAFGMGIDKADVRAIIHYNMPKNLESYVQEIGRAGRDGLVSQCHLFLDNLDGRDVQELKRFIFVNSIDRVTVRKLLEKIFIPCICTKLKNLESTTEGVTASVTARQPCPKHEVAISVAQLVEHLDIPEENILTLLCYLELRNENLLQLLPNVYGSCTVACYGGPAQLCAVSKTCPPLAVAIAKDNQQGISHSSSNSITFPVVQIASEMGWNSGVVKRELKALEWSTSAGGSRPSGVKVEFSDLCFHLMTRGDLSDDNRDRILDELHARALQQETDQLRQLQYTHQTLRAASHASILLCSDQVDLKRCASLKEAIGRYFSPDSEELEKVVLETDPELTSAVENGVRQDVRTLLSTHLDQTWTARAVARVFHGIQSPNFPAVVWGRVRRVWRAQIAVPFKHVLAIAQQEIIKWRKLC